MNDANARHAVRPAHRHNQGDEMTKFSPECSPDNGIHEDISRRAYERGIRDANAMARESVAAFIETWDRQPYPERVHAVLRDLADAIRTGRVLPMA